MELKKINSTETDWHEETLFLSCLPPLPLPLYSRKCLKVLIRQVLTDSLDLSTPFQSRSLSPWDLATSTPLNPTPALPSPTSSTNPKQLPS